ncbi:MAG: hypothetical protein QOJ69_2060 [Actinomycetota bacterium]|nr:hypothetical protein [Actinomycetota bacterium]
MSYLDGPRLAFAGDFQADVSTVNNDVRHFDNDSFQDRFQDFQLSQTTAENGWWNPVGSGAFRLLGCTVRGAAGVDGDEVVGDPVIGAAIGGSSDRVAAKMVDLDPQWQMSSELWGLRIEVTAGGKLLLGGQFVPAGFRDLGRQPRAARYQSALTGVEWAPAGRSAFVDGLREATDGDMLSVRLVTFLPDLNRLSARFTIGTVLGAIGPFRAGEPKRFVAGRRFAPAPPPASPPPPPPPPVNYFDGAVSADAAAVTLDLGNALTVADVGAGVMADSGSLRLVLLARRDLDQDAVVVEGSDFTALGGPIDYRGDGWLSRTSGVVRVPVPPAVRAELARRPLALVATAGGVTRVTIRETIDGWNIRADDDLHRVDAGVPVSAAVHVTKFGVPVPGATPVLRQVPPLSGIGVGRPGLPGEPTADVPDTGTPPGAVRAEDPAATDADGRTVFTIRTSDPGHPRGYLDGQIYQFKVRLAEAGTIRQHRNDNVSIVVYDGFEVPDRPTWSEHVKPILTQYGNLYPIMSRRLVDLGDLVSVKANRALLRFAFDLDRGDPNHMPVTRDLSGPKRQTLLRWLDSPDLAAGDVDVDVEGPPVRGRLLADEVEPPAGPPDDDDDAAAGPPAVDSKTLFDMRYAAALGDEDEGPP